MYADPAAKISGIITENNAHPRVGTLGLSVRVTMKTANGYHTKIHGIYVYDITQTLRPSVPTGWMETWWRINAVFNDIYETKIGMSRISFYTELTLNHYN